MSTPDPATTPWVPLWPLGIDPVPLSTKAQPNGVASLGADGKIPAAQLPATALAAGTAIIGAVSGAGGVLSGTGFTVVRVGVGSYTVTFNSPFPVAPSVVATLLTDASTGVDTIQLSPVGVNSFGVTVQRQGTGNADIPFMFIASQGVSYTPTPMSDKTVGGIVTGTTGAIQSGTGFTVVRTAAGQYNITFTTPFPSVPIILSGVRSGANYTPITTIQNPTINGFTLNVQGAANNWVDADFEFIASLGFTYTPSTLLGKMINGSVGATGAIVAGAGFTVTKGAAGIYTINFTNAFPTPPIVIVQGLAATGNPNIIVTVTNNSAVITLGTSDQPFVFTALDMNLAVASSTAPGAGATLTYFEDTTATVTFINGTVTVITAPSVNCDGSTPILITYYTPLYAYANGLLNYKLFMDGVELGILHQDVSSVARQMALTLRRRFVPAAGAHIFSIRATANSAAGSDQAGAGGVGVLFPRHIHITTSP